jgi:O-acetyl-ADP-ribose deacetylase (regulator of RNase III)
MVRIVQGNLLDSKAEALVNTVNTVGVMGKGIALQFKRAFPANFKAYESAVRMGEVALGRVFVFQTGSYESPKYILNFPTKKHWRSRSRIEDIKDGLADLRRVLEEYEIHSVAVPPLGCGQGGLEWSEVRPLIEEALSDLEGVEVEVFAPAGAPEPSSMRTNTARPNMTRTRAAVVLLLRQYLQPGYTANNLEVQKLAYLLQSRGEPLKLSFVAHKYGPYAENLQHVLQRMEGHFIHGYGDRATAASIEVDPSAVEEAERYVDSIPGTPDHLKDVAALIEGFETPYGLELLATVHWVATTEQLKDLDAAVARVQSWSSRKADLFRDSHIKVAWDRLRATGWITTPILTG